MLSSYLIAIENLEERLYHIKTYLDLLESAQCKGMYDLPRSPLSYNAVMISLYSCYENFVDDILEIYIDKVVSMSETSAELPVQFKKNNLMLSSEFLESPQRFKNLNLDKDTVIDNIYLGKVTKKLLLKHGGNLSIGVISDLFNSLGISNILLSIKKNKSFITYFSERSGKSIADSEDYLNHNDYSTVFNVIESLILERNSIAHSWKIDDKISFEIVKNEWLSFIEVFCKCIHEEICISFVKWAIEHNKLYEMKIFKIYGSSVVGFFNEQLDINDNKTIIVVKNSIINICNINSIRLHSDGSTIEIEGCNLNKDNESKYSFYSFISPLPPDEGLVEEESSEISEKILCHS